MSVVLVCFPGAPKVSEEAVKKEEELDKYLEARVEGEHTAAPGGPWTHVSSHLVCVHIKARFPPVLLSHTHTLFRSSKYLNVSPVLQPVLS